MQEQQQQQTAFPLVRLPDLVFLLLFRFLPLSGRTILSSTSKTLRDVIHQLDPTTAAMCALNRIINSSLNLIPTDDVILSFAKGLAYEDRYIADSPWRPWQFHSHACEALLGNLAPTMILESVDLPPTWQLTYCRREEILFRYYEYDFSQSYYYEAVTIPLDGTKKTSLTLFCMGERENLDGNFVENVRFFAERKGSANQRFCVYITENNHEWRYAASGLASVAPILDATLTEKHLASLFVTAFPALTRNVRIQSVESQRWEEPPGLSLLAEEVPADKVLADEILQDTDILTLDECVWDPHGMLRRPYVGIYQNQDCPFLGASAELNAAVDTLRTFDRGIDRASARMLYDHVSAIWGRASLFCFPATFLSLLVGWTTSNEGGAGSLPIFSFDPVTWVRDHIKHLNREKDSVDGDEPIGECHKTFLSFQLRGDAGIAQLEFRAKSYLANEYNSSIVGFWIFWGHDTIPVAESCQYSEDTRPPFTIKIDLFALEAIRNACGLVDVWPDLELFGVMLVAVGLCAWDGGSSPPMGAHWQENIGNEVERHHLYEATYPWYKADTRKDTSQQSDLPDGWFAVQYNFIDTRTSGPETALTTRKGIDIFESGF
ncbi:hypothetical protein HKX48_005982 [Thoreauomyces humboldtii]|nr:hypothetical protein HKX48_005982 [Thoreauomyces humboldtii]